MADIIIIGGGGHARVVIEAIRTMNGMYIKGIVDGRLARGEMVLSCPVIGNDSILECNENKGSLLTIGVGHMEAGDSRKKLYDKFKSLGYNFVIVRHSSAVVSDDVTISEGVHIMAGAVLQPLVSVGVNSIINTSALIEHDCKICNNSHIASGSILGGGVTVGECSVVGLGARVMPGVRIGNGVMIGAGAVVTSDVEDGRTVTGIPAK